MSSFSFKAASLLFVVASGEAQSLTEIMSMETHIYGVWMTKTSMLKRFQKPSLITMPNTSIKVTCAVSLLSTNISHGTKSSIQLLCTKELQSK